MNFYSNFSTSLHMLLKLQLIFAFIRLFSAVSDSSDHLYNQLIDYIYITFYV